MPTCTNLPALCSTRAGGAGRFVGTPFVPTRSCWSAVRRGGQRRGLAAGPRIARSHSIMASTIEAPPLTAASRLFLSPHFFADRRMPRSGRRAAFTRFLAFPLSVFHALLAAEFHAHARCRRVTARTFSAIHESRDPSLFREPIENRLRAANHLVRLAHPVVEIAEFKFFAVERCQHVRLAWRRRHVASGGKFRLGRHICRRGPCPSPACQHPGAAGMARRPRFRT